MTEASVASTSAWEGMKEYLANGGHELAIKSLRRVSHIICIFPLSLILCPRPVHWSKKSFREENAPEGTCSGGVCEQTFAACAAQCQTFAACAVQQTFAAMTAQPNFCGNDRRRILSRVNRVFSPWRLKQIAWTMHTCSNLSLRGCCAEARGEGQLSKPWTELAG